jgi:hypothetical protein
VAFNLQPGERILVVEDVVTTGGSTREVMEVVSGLGGVTVGAGSLIDRSGGTVDLGCHAMRWRFSRFRSISRMTVRSVVRAHRATVKPGSRTSKMRSVNEVQGHPRLSKEQAYAGWQLQLNQPTIQGEINRGSSASWMVDR